MSMKDRLAKKTQDLVFPAKGDVVTPTNPMRTGPGQMLMVNSLMKESNEKLAVLEQRVKEFEGGLPVLLLDPEQIVASRWANRISQSFDNAAFRELKSDIADAGGNVQPIKVRPVAGLKNEYEIIFGHRRHRACAQLKLPVLSLVENLTDLELFKQMDRENRSRADLSPWEQGMMYKQALQDKLFTSREQLSKEIGIDAGNLSKAIKLAELDTKILNAFSSPLDLQYRWAKPLADALLHEHDRVMEVLNDFVKNPSKRKNAKYVFDCIAGISGDDVRIDHVRLNDKVVAEIHIDRRKVTVKFATDSLNENSINRLKNFISSELTLS